MVPWFNSTLNCSWLPPRTLLACAIVGLAMVLGGGGSSAPLSEMLLEVGVALLAAGWIVSPRASDCAIQRSAMVLAGVIILLPMLQLIPLPPSIWHRLPGRNIERELLGLVNADTAWMPWTVSPACTAAALLAMLPPALVLCIVSSLDRKGRAALLATIAVLGFASLLLGALQLADGTERSWRFYVDNPGYLNGFQANRNAEADILLIALAAFGCLMEALQAGNRRRRVPPLLGAGGSLVLLLGCVLTGSRAGIAIGCLVVLVLVPWRRVVKQPRRAGGLTAAVLIGGLLLAQAHGGALAQIGDRFTWTRDLRLDLWRDTLPAVRSVLPAGSGIGTFRPLFEISEPLTSIDPTVPVRAHDDYLEFVLEGGAAAIAVLAAALIATSLISHRAWRVARRHDRPTLVFVATTFGIIALHSLVDYPLRCVSIAVLAAASTGMLFAIARDGIDSERKARA